MASVSINKPFSNIVWFDCFDSNDIKTLNIAIKHELGISGVLERTFEISESDTSYKNILFCVSKSPIALKKRPKCVPYEKRHSKTSK